jgi:3-methyladenine DNA glycosylase AlkD
LAISTNLQTAASVKKDLAAFARPHRVSDSLRFFKTGPGEYGEGDLFIGVTVPDSRIVARDHKDLPLAEIQKLLNSKIHEERFVGLAILVNQFKKAQQPKTLDEAEQKRLFDFYLKNLYAQRVNNWDLIDATAPYLGYYLLGRRGTTKLLDDLAKSKSLWERRAAVIFTFAFIREYELDATLRLSKKLLNDPHDLMHKACGWMLRELGKKEISQLRGFLEENVNQMPRTMLRYSIEKMSERERQMWLKR